MENGARIFTFLMFVVVLTVLVAYQSRATLPLATTVPGMVLSTETPEPTFPVAQVISNPPLPSTTSDPLFSSTPVQITPNLSSPIATPAPTLSSPPEETGEPGDSESAHNPFSYATVETISLGKLSGVVFHPQRQTLFAVSDKGHVIEFEPDGTLVQQKLVRKKDDFEGITSHLEFLMRYPGQALSRTQIAEHVWDYNFFSTSNVVDVYVRYLRRKIDQGFEIKLIKTVRGVGYKIEAEP
jgi:hypothetical protein